jgi:hypothetical protein
MARLLPHASLPPEASPYISTTHIYNDISR